MKIKTDFSYTNSYLPPIPGWKIVVGILLGLFLTFTFYNLLYLTREGIRILMFPSALEHFLKLPVLVLPEHIFWRHNLFFAFIAAIFGQSLCFLYWFDIPVRKSSKSYLKVKTIVNEFRYLNLNFINWFSRLAFVFSICVGTLGIFSYYKPEEFGKYDYLLFLFLPVLFLHTWMTLRRTVKHSFRKLLLSLVTISGIAFLLSFYHPINYKNINDILLKNNIWYAYKIELPESDYTEQMGGIAGRRGNILMVQAKETDTDTSPLLFIDGDDKFELIHLDALADILTERNQSGDGYIFNKYILYIDKNILMKDVIHLKKEILKGGTFVVYYGTVFDNNLYSRYHGIKSLISIHYDATNPIEKVQEQIKELELKNIWEIKHLSSDLLSINGEKVNLSTFKRHVKNLIESDPEYAIIYQENEDLLFQDYVNVIGIIRSAAEELRDEYALRNYNKEAWLLEWEMEKDIIERFPYRVVEIPGK